MKKKLLIITCIFFFCFLSIYCLLSFNQKETYTIGRKPHCFLFNIIDDTVFFKDDVLINDTYKFQGLYKKDINAPVEDSGELIYDKYYSCVNFYKGSLYFIDIEYNILKYDLKSKKVSKIINSDESNVRNLLIIDNYMYYLQGDKDDNFSLYSYNLETKVINQIVKSVDWLYLYNYGSAICTLSKNKDKIYTWSPVTQELKEYDSFEFEVLQIRDDSSVLCYGNNKLYLFKNLESKEYEEIVNLENIISVISSKSNILITTLDPYGMIEIYMYSIPKKSIKKIANVDYIPREFNNEYILCCSDSGLGDVQIINIKNGSISTFARH